MPISLIIDAVGVLVYRKHDTTIIEVTTLMSSLVFISLRLQIKCHFIGLSLINSKCGIFSETPALGIIVRGEPDNLSGQASFDHLFRHFKLEKYALMIPVSIACHGRNLMADALVNANLHL